MAEVKIDIRAEDEATPVLKEVGAAVEALQSSVAGMESSFGSVSEQAGVLVETLKSGAVSEFSGEIASAGDAVEGLGASLGILRESISATSDMLAALDDGLGKEFTIDASGALLAIDDVEAALAGLSTTRTLGLDVSDALGGAMEVQAALDAIPDVTYKSVVIRYQTQASPVMDFSEGMEYIKQRMESLPTEGSYTLNYLGLPEEREAAAHAPSGQVASSRGTVNLTANVTVNAGADGEAGGDALAARIDRALADLWRYNRSELKKAVSL